MLFAYEMLPLCYLCSLLFNVPASSYSSMAGINLFLGGLLYLMVSMMASISPNMRDTVETAEYVLFVSPLYCLCSAIRNLYSAYSIYNMCNSITEMCVKNIPNLNLKQCQDMACNYAPECCSKFQLHFFSYIISSMRYLFRCYKCIK